MNALRRQLYALNAPSQRCFSTSSSRHATYGFIGLGQMGYRMAQNLRANLPSSDNLIVHDVNSEATARFAKENSNVQIAEDVRDVAEKSETIITALPGPSHVQNVFRTMLSPPTLLRDGVHKERLFIDCSTIDPLSSADVANAAHSTGQGRFIDAPMSGGIVGAANAKLTFMIGAPAELVDRATEVLMLMGKRVIHLGPQTSGLKGKLANNYLLALNNIATAEAMNMGVQWGLDPSALADMINTSTGKCWPSEVNNPVPGVLPDAPASKEYTGGFGTALMNKDLKLAMHAAQQFGIEPRLGPMAASIYAAIEGNEKYKGKDFSVVYKYLRGE